MQRENKVSLKATWTDEESKQPRWVGGEGVQLRGVRTRPSASLVLHGPSGRRPRLRPKKPGEPGGGQRSPPKRCPGCGPGSIPHCPAHQPAPAGLADSLRAQAIALATPPPPPPPCLAHPPCADPSPSEESDQTAIHQTAIRSYYQLIAAAVGNVEWLRFCLNQSHGEIPTNNKGFTAIHFAAQRGKLACLQVLIEEYKFPVDLLTKDSQTPLHLVIHRDNTSVALPCIYYLLEKGAALNVRTCNGSTPLHLAAREGLLDCMKVLVQSGANVHAQDAMGYKPIDFCKIWNHRACARFLKDAMWKKDKKDFAREMGKMKTFKSQLALMEHNYLIEYQDMSPLSD
ncbi:Ankyrin repeat domain-containing protein 53 [Saguinus oedipus]|uniref:Ankyrin repeat domain-containing protein 53 n=1 Tax=Saguinus oedipus TaxID=9490 RepID=A0ABQ9U792_SAGOE|nr:Ankyrin repeat domain-containing protein 53 [Saguinus oedipus]